MSSWSALGGLGACCQDPPSLIIQQPRVCASHADELLAGENAALVGNKRTADKIEQQKENNRAHARLNRVRKKQEFEELKARVEQLSKEKVMAVASS